MVASSKMNLTGQTNKLVLPETNLWAVEVVEARMETVVPYLQEGYEVF